jgi:transposase-like protein
MGVSRRKYGASFKARVALEAIREKKTIHSLANPFEIYPAFVTRWRKEMLAGAQQVFWPGDGGQSKGRNRKKWNSINPKWHEGRILMN